MCQTRSIAIAWKNLVSYQLSRMSGYLQYSFRFLFHGEGPLQPMTKIDVPALCWIASKFHWAVTQDLWQHATAWQDGIAGRKMQPPNCFMSPNGKLLISGIQVLLLLHHSDLLYEPRNSCFALANTMLIWLCAGSGIQLHKWINKKNTQNARTCNDQSCLMSDYSTTW